MAKLLSVNVSLPRDLEHKGKIVRTGIFKEPVQGPVMLGTLNVDGDGQGDPRVHGGPYMAVYSYRIEDYDYWKRKLKRDDFTFGQFGENFTIEGLDENDVHIGDVYKVGEAVIKVTQPRAPCSKLGIRMGNARFPKMFLASGRVGFYSRVLQEGMVAAGDPIERLETGPERMTVREVLNLLYFDLDNVEGAERALRTGALSPNWSKHFAERVSRRLEY